MHCPIDEGLALKMRCHCDPKDTFDWKDYSCTQKYFDVSNMTKPVGWWDHTG